MRRTIGRVASTAGSKVRALRGGGLRLLEVTPANIVLHRLGRRLRSVRRVRDVRAG